MQDFRATTEKRPEVRDLLGVAPNTGKRRPGEGLPTKGAEPVFANDFSVGLWVEVPQDRAGAAGGLVSKFDPKTRLGFNLSAVSSAGGYNGPGDEIRVSFGMDAGKEPIWAYRGRPSPTSNFSTSLTVFDGRLHAGSNDGKEPKDWAHVYRLAGDTEWEDLGQVSKEGSHGIGPMVVHRGSLFVAAWNHDYTRVHHQDLAPCRVYRYVAPNNWEDCGEPGRSKRLFSIASYHGDLYVVGDDWTVQVYRGGQTWEEVAKLTTFAHPMSVADERLAIATWEDPPTVLTYDGADWDDLGNPLNDPIRCTQIHSLAIFGDALHAGHWPLGRISRWDKAARRWRQLGRLGDSTEINAMAAFNGKLYAGALPRAEVFRYEHDGKWTSLRRFRDEPGWRPILPNYIQRLPDADERVRSLGRVTSLTEHDGLLFASVTSCTGAAVDAPTDERGSVFALRAGAVATSPNSLDAGWHHVVGVRRGAKLTVYVDGHESASSDGFKGSIATNAPLWVGQDQTASYAHGRHGFAAADKAWSENEVRLLLEATKPGAAASAA